MYDRGGSPDFGRLSSEQHVSLEKHEQMIQNALKWQAVRKFDDEQQKPITKPLYTRLTELLSSVIGSIQFKQGNAHQESRHSKGTTY